MGFAPLRDALFLGPRMRATIGFFHFGMFFYKNVFNQIFKEAYRTVGFAPLQDRLLAAPRMRPSIWFLHFGMFFLKKRFQ